jgi:DNA-binding MarR family transcriptional regulator
VTTSDPTRTNRWRPLFELLRSLDADIERVYAEAGHAGFRTRFTLPLVRLSRRGPMTITALAAECDVSHSAMSQTVSAMRRTGLVDTVPDPADGRARLVELTASAAGLVELGEAEWAATEATLAELEDEVPYALSRVVLDLERRLAERSFADRLRRHLDAP